MQAGTLLLYSVEKSLGLYEGEQDTYLKMMEKESIPSLYLKLGEILQTHTGSKSIKEAYFAAGKHFFEKAKQELITLETVYLALVSLYDACGDFKKMEEHFGHCKQMVTTRIEICELKPDHKYGVILDLNLAWIKKAEAEIKNELKNQFDEAYHLNQEVRKILAGYYRREDHPTVLDCDLHCTWNMMKGVRIKKRNLREAKTNLWRKTS